MAENKIHENDIFAGDVFERNRRSAESFGKVLDELEQQMRALLDASIKVGKESTFDSYKDIERTNEALEKAGKAVDVLNDVQKEREALERRLARLNTEAQKQNEALRAQVEKRAKAIKDAAREQSQGTKLERAAAKAKADLTEAESALNLEIEITKAQLNEKRKATRLEAKEAAGLVDEYGKQSKRLTELKREYKNMALTQGTATEESRALLREIEALDFKLKELDSSVGESTRRVGSYKQAIRQLELQVEGLNNKLTMIQRNVAFIALVSLFSALRTTFFDTVEGAVLFERTMQRMQTVTRAAFNDAKRIFGAFIDGFAGAEAAAKAASSSSMLPDWADSIGEFFIQTKAGFSAMADEVEKGSSETAKAVNDIFDSMSGAEDETDKLARAIATLPITLSKMAVQAQRITAEFEKQDRLAVSVLSNITEQGAATVEAANEAAKLAEQELAIANKEFEVAKQRLEIHADSIDAQIKLNEAQVARTEAQSQLEAAQFAQRETAFTEARDEAARRMAQYDAEHKAEVERISLELESTKISEARRRELEAQLITQRQAMRRLAAEEFIAVEAVRQAERAAALGKEEDAKSEMQIREEVAAIMAIESDNLVEQAKLRAAAIEALDVEESTKQALLALLRDETKEMQTQANLAERQAATTRRVNELNASTAATLDHVRALDLEGEGVEEVAAKYPEIFDGLDKIKDTRMGLRRLELLDMRFQRQAMQMRLEDIDEEVKAVGAGTQEAAQLERERANTLLAIKRSELNEREWLRQNNLEKLKKFEDASFEIVKASVDRITQLRLRAIDMEVNASRQRIQSLNVLAARGLEDASNNIALEEQRQAELEQRRERALRRQRQAELALAAVRRYSEAVKAGDKDPLGTTATDIGLLRAFIGSIPAFWEGAERVGDDLAPQMAGRDGHIVRVDGGERVMPTRLNKAISGISNERLAALGEADRAGTLGGRPVSLDSSQVVGRLASIEQAIKSQPVYLGRDYDATANAVVETIKRGNTMRRTFRKNSIFKK